MSLAVTPREEGPQIVLPTADVHVSTPGLSAQQVEIDYSGSDAKVHFWRTHEGKVAEIVPQAEAGSRSFLIKVELRRALSVDLRPAPPQGARSHGSVRALR